jgi:hypothetical protein
MQYDQAVFSQAIAMVCSHVESPLSLTPWAHSSQQDNESCDVLERYEKYHPVYNKVMQDTPSEQKTDT